ncbi:MAG: 3-phosphoshikimate 1-carboxyvinyltransferase [Candidatus Eiseniibacteriota bacterium]|jgi:3-phosphoshikimate 1-carboxyvinyltransferase
METLKVASIDRLRGTFVVPGDKSITHRAYLLGGLASGATTIHNPNPGRDCEASLRAMTCMGARATVVGEGAVQLEGVAGELAEPPDVVDCGNSGTTMRLLAGVAAQLRGVTVMSGDASLRGRPMHRIIEPLERMGAEIWCRDGGLAPLVLRGGGLHGIRYELPMASAQVKSAVLLAGLAASGRTTVVERLVSRDHTERMLRHFGVEPEIEPLRRRRAGGAPAAATGTGAPGSAPSATAAAAELLGPRTITVRGGSLPRGAEIRVPGDPSAAAFFVVAALVHGDAEITVENVGVNPTRRGILDALIEMGGAIEVRGVTQNGHFEPVATVVARSSELRPIELAGDRIPAIIDELPVFAVAAAFASGSSVVRDAGELRFKESDRITLICRNLAACGVRIEERQDGFVVHGGARPHGAEVEAEGDHRIAMAMAALGLAARGTMTIGGAGGIPTSFPDFVEQLRRAGGVR